MTKNYNIVETYVCKTKGYAKLKDCNCINCEMENKKKTLKKSGIHHLALCENVVAANLNPNDIPLKHTLSIGTIVVAAKKVDNSKRGVVISEYEKKHSKYFGKTWVCPLTSLMLVPPEIVPYILPVPSLSRVHILKEKELCANLEALQADDEVYVLNSAAETPSKAVIKYKGPCPKYGEGIFFEVELLDKHEDSPAGGNSQGKRLPSNFIVASDRIRVKPPPVSLPMIYNRDNGASSVHQLRKKFENMSLASQPRYTGRLSPSPPPVRARVGKLIDIDEPLSRSTLKVKDRVVWLGDDGPITGVILDFREPSEVILHLDNPMRTHVKPFRLEHDMKVPLFELIKYEDFYDKREDKKDLYSLDTLEKSCQASSENQRNSQLERRPTPSIEPAMRVPASEPWCNKLRNCYTEANAPPIDIPNLPPRPLDKYLRLEEDYCDYPHEPPPHFVPAKASPNLSSSSSNLDDFGDPQSPADNLDNHLDLGVGSMVEVLVNGIPYYGVIRWIGQVYGTHGDTVAGIEMEQEHELFCDGQIQNKQRFFCNPKRGHFAPLFQCRKDPRFIESHSVENPSYPSEQEFGGPSCPIIPGAVPPLNKEKSIESLCGKMRGIQGHHNSCYLDATLFAMFTFTSVFDSLLFRPPPDADTPYTQVQQVLREEIVNPLRRNLFVRADRVMHLRHLLNELSSVSGLTSEEKDPEEFLTSLVAQILRAEPFLKLSSGQETYHYQLFVEKDEKLRLPSVQQLFEQSFFTSDIKLKEVPSCLIIQMPRFGKAFKVYPRILPSQLLDITDVLEASPRQCTICGKLAEFECRKCFDQRDSGLESIWYCRTCLERTHTHEKRTDHESCWRQLSLPDYFLYDQECPVARVYMELFAVVCIETSHYVAFVKGGSGCDAPWCFFDSMADRKGERNGYNIPEMVPCPELPYWLSEEGSHVLSNIPDDRQLPEYAKRLMCDAYMVMYQSPELMMYR